MTNHTAGQREPSARSRGYVACFECEAVTETHDHHIIPASRGGKKTVPLCLLCHGKAHGRSGGMTTSALTKEALAKKIARRERVGRMKYGFDLSGDGITLIENEGEKRVVSLIKSMRMSGDSYRAIAAELTRRGIPTKSGKARWCHNTIKGIVGKST